MAKRIDQLDGIRALAILAVFLHHAFRIRLLWMGVDLFFILSGFLITGILLKHKEQSLGRYFGHFYARRARRILPPYLLLLLVTSLLFGVAWARHWYFYLFLMNIQVVGIPQPMALSLLWSLAVEEQFYLVWPFVMYFLSEEAITWVAAAIVLGTPVLRWFCTPLFSDHWPIYVLTPFRMDLLAVGALLALIWRKRPDTIRRFGLYGPILSVLAVLVLAILSRNPAFTTTANTQLSNVWVYELSLFINTGIILWALSGKGVWILTLAPVRYLGLISYTVYLIHLTAIVLAERFFQQRIATAVIAFALTLLYSSASWFFLEKPLLSSKSEPHSGPIAEKV
jgi:peptidoglycan/LPS O-acetylase OafA/YrhL